MGHGNEGGQVPLEGDRGTQHGEELEATPTPDPPITLALEHLRAEHQQRLDRLSRQVAARPRRPAVRSNLQGARGVLEAIGAAPLPVAR